jgi:2-methylcitrate dehydratase PrpD
MLATALGFDVSARINLSLKVMDIVDGQFRWTSIGGMGFASFGAAATSGVVCGLHCEQMRNAFGLAGWLAPGRVQHAKRPLTRSWAGYHDD